MRSNRLVIYRRFEQDRIASDQSMRVGFHRIYRRKAGGVGENSDRRSQVVMLDRNIGTPVSAHQVPRELLGIGSDRLDIPFVRDRAKT